MYKIYTKILCWLNQCTPQKLLTASPPFKWLSEANKKKLIMRIKLTTVLLIATLMQVSASVFSQQLNYRQKNVSLSQVFKEIKKQTGYNVVWFSAELDASKKINADFLNTPLEQVLNNALKDSQVSYTIEDKTIILKKKTPSFLEKLTSVFANVMVKGVVHDNKGTPLSGASVVIKGTNKMVMTNDKGEFLINVSDENAVLVISYIGYKTFEVSAKADLRNITLQIESSELKEVAVNVVSNGYQTIAKERSAGSFAKVDMDVVSNRTTSMNVLQSLDGQVPGLVVNNVPNRSQLLIRGLATTGGTTGTATTSQPLYVVDGLAQPAINPNDNLPDFILGINPQDIADITVLKDATAASIWGARAANGVIVINTKSGKFGSKMKINYNGFVNFQGKPDLGYANLLSPSQFVQTGREIFNTPGYTAQYPYATVSALNGSGYTPLEYILYNPKGASAAAVNNSVDSLAALDNRDQIKNLLYRSAMLSNHTLSITGGGDKYAFYGSGSYTNVVSTTPGEKNETFKINLRQDIKATNFLSFYIITDISNTVGSAKRPYSADYFFTPYQLFRDANGNNLSIPYLTGQSNEVLANASARARISLDYNPLNEFDYGNTQTDAFLTRLNTGFKLNIFKGLRFEGTYGYIKGANKVRDFESLQSYTVRKEIVQFTVAADPTVVPKYYLPINGGRLTTANGDQHKWDIRNQLIYDYSWGKHQLTVLAGQEAQESFVSNTQARVRGFDESLLTSQSVDFATISAPVLNTVLPTISTLASSMVNDSYATSESTNRFTSYYANLAYTFDHRYTFNTSWRRDQSNLFGKDKSAQNKPIYAVGAKWSVSNEQFMKPVNWVQDLALRLTYGITGNSPDAGVAASQDIIGPSGSAFFPNSIGARIITPGNPELSWERTANINMGLDFSVLHNRINASVDVYQKKTTDLIGLVYPNSLTGYPSIVGNQGDITNRGIELNIQSTNILTRNFSWTTTWIYAYNKNTVDKITSTTPITTGAQQVITSVAQGFPAYTLFAYRYGGLDNTGAPLVILADGTVTKNRIATKASDLAYMGSTQPVWNGGLSNNFTYKNFRLATNLVYNMGHVMRRQRYLTNGGQFRRNVSVDFLNRWKVPGDEANTDIPPYLTNSSPNAGAVETNYFYQGDVNVVSASFLKLRDATLFYDLPKFLVKKINVQGITLRAQLSNVMVWTANKYGIDPEFQGLVAPTNQKTVSLGINVSL